ncbi:MAG TPA: cation diffusion facilitator family transporter [Verrucomicrobiae bacterium]|nr:cation diffusion facilitator family transporter [Verrucomicrobiae bacterium]
MSDVIKGRLDRGARWAIVGLCANLVLAGGKMVAGVVGRSYALIADGIESCLDVFGSLVVMSGLRLAAVPPDADHPYGHGKAEPLAAAVVAIALLGAAVGLAAMSVREILEPHHAPAAFTLGVLISVVVVKEVLFRLIRNVGQDIGSRAVEADAWHHRSDAITSVAAFVGISVALVGGEGYEAADDWAALLACVVIGSNGARLLRPALAEIMDAAPPDHVVAAIRDAAAGVGGVDALDKCRVRKTGLNYYVDLHVRVDGAITVLEGHRIAHRVKDAVRANHPEVADVLVHVEPQADATGRSVGLGG